MKVAKRFKSLPAYQPIEPFEVLSERLGRLPEEIIKLDANENPFGPVEEVRRALADLAYPHIYPDPESRQLRKELMRFTGVPVENLMAGSGADELIDLVLRVLLEPDDIVINCPPTFGMYPFDTLLNNGKIININRDENFQLRISEIKAKVHENQVKALFLTSPNNPDGGMISDSDLLELLALPLMIILDEAYIEFSGDTPKTWRENSRIQWVAQYENLIVLRTFSKWAGLAGLRVGYGAFPSWLMPYLWKAKQPYNVNVAASAAALASLAAIQKSANNVAKIRRLREDLFQGLSHIPYLQPFPSQANFLLCKVIDRPAVALKEALLEKGILVRYYQSALLENMIRISVGRKDQITMLLKVLEEMK